jgi:hypothetical protein
MGYPASAALLFKALSEDQDKWLHDDAKRLVDKFSLFAIILADPVKDPIFYNQLQQDFEYYDRLTGSNLLFFSIVKERDLKTFLVQIKALKFLMTNKHIDKITLLKKLNIQIWLCMQCALFSE